MWRGRGGLRAISGVEQLFTGDSGGKTAVENTRDSISEHDMCPLLLLPAG